MTQGSLAVREGFCQGRQHICQQEVSKCDLSEGCSDSPEGPREEQARILRCELSTAEWGDPKYASQCCTLLYNDVHCICKEYAKNCVKCQAQARVRSRTDLIDSIDWDDKQDDQQTKHDWRVYGRSIQLELHAVVTEGGSAGSHNACQY